ncbi:TPA: hypothetical protein I7149_20120 [Vibrio vulnificus]|nr:hypothetical protein [Vibrio vulnificus]
MEKLKTREWLFVLVIIILIQFIIQASAWLYGGNSGALGYLSFAGTAVSIILAILAIMYSFLQSSSQEQSASNISNQVMKLVDVVDNIDMSKSELSETLSHLKSVSQKIDLSIEHQAALKKDVGNLKAAFSKFASSGSRTKAPHTSDSIHAAPFESGFNGVLMHIVFLYFGEKLDLNASETIEQLVSPILHKVSGLEGDDFYAYNEGAFNSVFQLLISNGSVSAVDFSTPFELHEEFEEICSNFIEFVKEGSPDLLKDIIELCEQKFV